MKKKRPLIIGNWKQNPATLARAEKVFLDIQKGVGGKIKDVSVGVAPPILFVADLKELAAPQKIDFLAQDVSSQESGAHTGDISALQLRSVGIKCSIIGHSERRSTGETDEMINQKLRALLAVRSVAILCIGENERDGRGDYFNMVEEQLEADLVGVEVRDLKNIIIAYEPVWAIGTGKSATSADVEEMKLFIQKILSDIYGRKETEAVRIIYGGSVNPDNAEELLKEGKVDGFLVGGASLEPKKFIEIIKIADKYARLA